MSVDDYYTKLMGLYEELAHFKPLRSCSCGQCSCDIIGKLASDRDEEKFHQFLIGIDDELYGTVRTNLLSRVPLPYLDDAYLAFTQEEQSQGIARGKCSCDIIEKLASDRDEETFHQFLIGIDDELYGTVRTNLLSRVPLPSLDDAYLAFTEEEQSQGIARGKASQDTITSQSIFALQADRSRRFEKDKSKLSCSHCCVYNCKQGGHDISTCFKIHGVPNWYEELRSRRNKNGPAALRSGTVPAATTSRPRGPPARANVVAAACSSDDGPEVTTSLDLTPTQTKVLLNMINNSKLDQMTGEFSATSWIIDTGASYHVTGDESCLTNVRPIHDCPISLPNGQHAIATKEGQDVLSDKLTLNSVLYVPSLMCNLLSVSQLTDDLRCFVRFTNSLCAIQDQHSGNLIGAGERKEGLYYFKRIPTVGAVSVGDLSTFELWHRRLGHPSDRVLKLVPEVKSSLASKKLNKACTKSKFASRSRRCAFVGYPNGKKGWKVYDMDTGNIFVSRDVKFHENEFPFELTHTNITDNSMLDIGANENVDIPDLDSDLDDVDNADGPHEDEAAMAQLDQQAQIDPPLQTEHTD
ncbi:uncharacterized protein [Spinacia oleracea]|uniref:GAG-pre-integrase domain-containing protein n=1 Tax=Spinacia oleracea TaxID=3562 RepID=A0ABM3RJJ8_SPIOL|nr:uncharacterized protein LOC110775464 [Spinacia oleracea]